MEKSFFPSVFRPVSPYVLSLFFYYFSLRFFRVFSPVFLYRFVGKLSCSGVDQEGFPGLTPPPAAAENDLPIFQQNFAGYLYKGNVGKVDQQTFSAVEKTITWCKADRQVGKCAAGCKISLNGVENQSVLAGFNVNQVVQRQPVFLGNTL